MSIAILDQKLNRQVLSNNPYLYKQTKGKMFSARIFSGWILRAFIHGTILYYVPKWCFSHEILHQDGLIRGLWYWSTTIYYCVVITPTLLVMFEMNSISLLQWLALLSSWSGLFVLTWLMNLFISVDFGLYMVVNKMMAGASFWLCFILTISIPFLLELLWRFVWAQLSPTLDLVGRREINGYLQNNPGIAEQAKAQYLVVDEAKWDSEAESKFSLFGDSAVAEATSEADMRRIAHFSTKKTAPRVSAEEAKPQKRPSTAQLNGMMASMVTLKKMTGSTFSSAAHHRHQTHHTLTHAQLTAFTERMAPFEIEQNTIEEE
jgi:hypothetical protein